MDRSEIMELRRLFKTYKEESCPVNGFSGGFIDAEGSVKGGFSVTSFHKAEDSIKKRIFTFAAKTISNNAVTVPIRSGAFDLFEKIKATKGGNKELAEELCERISKAIRQSGNENTYAVNIIGYSYDPPAKTSDHRTIIDGSSDEIYNFFVCMISKVTTSKASYGYFSDEEKFGMNPLLHIVENPAAGFVYPDFTGRKSNSDGVLYFRTEGLDISEALFGQEAPPLPVKERKKKVVAADNPVSAVEDEPTYSVPNSIPSLDTGSMSMEERRGRDIVAEKQSEKDSASEERKADSKDAEPNYTPVRGKKVRITGNTSSLVKKMVDGVMCFVVPVSEVEL